MYRQGLMAQGDYYQGDGLFSFIGSALKKVAPILPFGIGTAASAVGGLLSPQHTRAVALQNPIGAALPPLPTFSGFKAGPVQIGTSYAPGPGNRTQSQGGARGKKGPRPKKGEPGYRPKRMNVTNPRALRRAGRRVKGFEKLARRFIGFASARRPKGRMYFRAAAKKR